MPMPPSIMDSSKEIDRDITSLEDATAIKGKDGEYSSLILNKAVKEPLKLGDLGKGKIRIQVVVGMIEYEPVVMAEKDSVMEQQLIKKLMIK
ncbi:putative precorrin-6y methylase (plasmid) [Clostridium botulinum]|uniref:Putative precorrin-6y methylase n=1 Tax=Clostridium botulinum TaxID=1491 RepID=A0A1L7JN59_CLOBO|nr:putative precorrin-6y methylase [Clostridium botulinum]